MMARLRGSSACVRMFAYTSAAGVFATGRD